MDQRQINTFQLENFRDGKLISILIFIFWLTICLYEVQFGFGSDTDAWLMAQTAQKMRLGLGYDPARSFGNPVYEFLLVLIQPMQSWVFSNLFNMLVFSILILRLPAYFSFLKPDQISSARILWMLFPWFMGAATSSMEYIPALWFLLEAHSSIQVGKTRLAALFTVLAVFTRIEFLPILILANMPFWRRKWIVSASITFGWLLFLFWSNDKNPSPFSDWTSGFQFYRTRILVLFQSSGLCLFLLLPAIAFLGIGWKKLSSWTKIALFNLLIFCAFPFEWEYLLPAFGIILISFSQQFKPIVSIGFGLTLFIFFQIRFESESAKAGEFKPIWENIWHERKELTDQYNWAQTADFQSKTLIEYGATWFPTDVTRWEKVLDNRIFHRKNSNFFVAERLDKQRIDSLIAEGYSVINPESLPQIDPEIFRED